MNIKWEEGAPVPVGRDGHTAVLHNGVVCVGGGCTTDSDAEVEFPHTLDIYHTNTNTWDTIDTPHELFAVTVLADKVVIVGGRTTRDFKVTNKVLVLEIGQWKDYAEMPTARYKVTAVSHHSIMIVMGGSVPAAIGLNNKYLLAVGGNDIYTLNSTWMTIGTIPIWTVGTTVVCDEQSQLVMIGGWDMDGKSINKVWIGSFQ